MRSVSLAAVAVAIVLPCTAALTGGGGVAAAAAPPQDVDNYIVVLKDDGGLTPATAAERARRLGGSVSHVYTHALRGYAAQLPTRAVEAIRTDPAVAFIEVDGTSEAVTTQTPVTWGLDRIDQRTSSLDGSFTYTATGSGVPVYVVDTEIEFSHLDFGGRAVSEVDEIDGGTADDCHGHGTHVAGTVGGTTYGVAKDVTLVAVRVLDCKGSGPNSGVVAGVDWITGQHEAGTPAVANMSLISSPSSAIDMRRLLAFVAVLLSVLAVGSPASATIDVEWEVGGVVVTAEYDDTTRTISAGTIVTGDNGLPGLCAVGVLHSSCTPANE